MMLAVLTPYLTLKVYTSMTSFIVIISRNINKRSNYHFFVIHLDARQLNFLSNLATKLIVNNLRNQQMLAP